MQAKPNRCAIWLWCGLASGLLFGSASVAFAKFQCDSDVYIGRSHPATLVSVTVDGAPVVIPTVAAVPQLGSLYFKTELYDHPDMLHVDVFDDSLSPPVRKMHVGQK